MVSATILAPILVCFLLLEAAIRLVGFRISNIQTSKEIANLGDEVDPGYSRQHPAKISAFLGVRFT